MLMRTTPARIRPRLPARNAAFTLTDLLVTVAVASLVVAVAIAVATRVSAKSKLTQCLANLQQVNGAVLKFAEDNGRALPSNEGSPAPGGWWWYKELVKGYAGLTGASSAKDTVFACPRDRGYGDSPGESRPFCQSARHDFTSYVFNGVDLPGIPNVAGRKLASIPTPARTLLVMEWTAHAPLSWHRSRTGRANIPFYNDAESVVAFADGHAALVKIYYDGLNPAFTRDPPPGYAYQYSGD
jgi:prepilin-type processing-associated H-X9-DG protein